MRSRLPTVVYDKNADDVMGTMADSVFTIGSQQNLPANTFSRVIPAGSPFGYVFAGWALSQDGSPEYTDREFFNFSASAGSKVTLYAIWKEYPIIYPVLASDYDSVYPYIDSDTLVNTNMDTLLSEKGYKKLALKGTDIDTALSITSTTIIFDFPASVTADMPAPTVTIGAFNIRYGDPMETVPLLLILLGRIIIS